MKVILLQDIRNLGKRWDVKDVSDGYARNFLIARKLAVMADEKNLIQRNETIKKQDLALEKLKKEVQKLSGEKIEIEIKKGEDGEVFGSVNKEEIKKALAQKGYAVSDVELKKPIRVLGDFPVTVNLGKGIKTAVTIIVR